MIWLLKLFILFFPSVALAQLKIPDQILPDASNRAGAFDWDWDDIGKVLVNIAHYLLMAVGAVAIIFLIIGGYRYITSFGNPEAIQQAKGTITWAIIGLIVALLALLAVMYIRDTISQDVPFR